MTSKLEQLLQHPHELFIGGRWRSPSSDSKITVIQPATEQVFVTVASLRPASGPVDASFD